MIPGIFAGAANAPNPNFVALPLTYDEVDHAAAMTWVRQGNGPHVTPLGFEGDGYGARLKSTTIPAWMTSASAVFTMHASVSFYPQQCKSSSEFVVYAGEDDSSPFAKLTLSVAPDATNSAITQIAVNVGTGGTGFVQKKLGRSGWRFEFRSPDITVGGDDARMQAIVFLDADTVLVSSHFEDVFTRVWKVRISDGVVLGSFDASGDLAHIGVFALRSNGDLWALAASGKGCRIDLSASLASGTIVVLDILQFSGFSASSIMGGIEFVTVSGTEYAVMAEYLVTGAPYLYAIPASALGTVTLTPSDRYKRFTDIALETQGCCMRSGKLMMSSFPRIGTGTGSRFGYIDRVDIVTAITSTSDGGAITSEAFFDAPTKYAEDIAVHPSTNDLWMLSEGITAVGSDASGVSVWSSPLDGSLAENHYTLEYDGSGTTTIKINNRICDALSGTAGIAVDCVTVGGPPATAAGITARYFTGYVRNVVLQDQPMTTAQYNAAVSGSYESSALTAYTFTLTNPGAESGSATGWTAEAGGMVSLLYPSTTGTLPHGGSYIFSGGNNASSISRQRLDVLAQTGLSGGQVDAGGIWAKVRWWQTNADAIDSGAMGIRTLNSTPTSTGEAYAGVAIMPNISGSYRPWYPRAFSAALASGTRYIDALIKQTRPSGTANDAQFDDISVTVYRQ